MTDEQGLRQRVTKQGEEAIGKLAQELLENPVVSGAITRAFETRERAVHAQEVAMGALNLPSASDLERLTRRIRSVSQRLEGIEDGLDRLEQKLQGLGGSAAIEKRLAEMTEAPGCHSLTDPLCRTARISTTHSPSHVVRQSAASRPRSVSTPTMQAQPFTCQTTTAADS